MEARYHVNGLGEVGPCRARIKCRFGGASGQENHFISRADAENFIQKNLAAKYGPAQGLKKATHKELQAKARHSLLALKKGGIQVNTVPSIMEYSFTQTTGSSQVEVLEETPTPEFLARIKLGDFQKAFNK
jgi:hypothetical protein